MPNSNTRRRVVIDTDTANEIDDQFAIAWALRAPESMKIEGVYAAPFSHGRFFSALASAATKRGHATTDFERLATGMEPGALEAFVDRTPASIGMTKSYEEIFRVFEAAGVDPGNLVKRGAAEFLPEPRVAVESEAARDLIALAKTASPDDPIHVATICAPTNIASALLIDPSIAPNLIVLFLAGFPSGAGLDDDSFNLLQDRWASNVLLESDVPLVYIPGYHIAETLQLSLPAAREWLGGQGRLAEYLLDTYEKNPINPDISVPGQGWVLWDIIATAWLIDPSWVPTRSVPRARVKADHCWERLSSGSMDEAYHVNCNDVMRRLFEDLTGDGV